MKPTVVLLLATVALVGAAGTAAASSGGSGAVAGTAADAPRPNGQPGIPAWPGNDTAGNDTAGNGTAASPGQQLAGAVGAQAASVQGELWNRTLTERLANATTADERAEVLAEEVEVLETYVDALEGVRGNLTAAWDNRTISEGQYRASLSAFVIRAAMVERRANRTARAAERLPGSVRERYDVNVTHIRNLAERAHGFYQFEGPIARQVVNETLSNRSALVNESPRGERANRTRSGD